MRGRAWRREIKDLKIIKRLIIFSRYKYWRMEDANGSPIDNKNYINLLGTPTYYMSKTHGTSKYDTKSKHKYSPNKDKSYYRGHNRNRREKDKLKFLNILIEYGIK